MTIKKELVHAYIWNSIGKYAVRSLGLVSTLFLVRLLSPADFGVMAMAMLVVAFLDVLTNTGVKRYLIVHQVKDATVLNSCWTLNLCFKVFFLAILYLSAPTISNYFGESSLTFVIEMMCLIYSIKFMENIAIVQDIILLKYKKINKIQIIAKIISAFTTIVAAYFLRNYMALVYGAFVHAVVKTSLSYYMYSYRPMFTLKVPQGLITFSSKVFVRDLLSFCRSKLDVVLVSKLFGSTGMGKYTIAQEFSILPQTEIITPAMQPLLSALSRYRNSKKELLDKTYKYLALIYLFIIPAIAGVMITSTHITYVILGPKWQGIESIISSLALLMLPFSLQPILNNLYDCHGKSITSSYVDFVGILLLISAFITLIPSSIEMFSNIRAVIAVVIYILMALVAKAVINFSLLNLLKVLLIPLIATSIMVIQFKFIYINQSLTMKGLIENIILGGGTYVISSALLLLILHKIDPLWGFLKKTIIDEALITLGKIISKKVRTLFMR